MVKDLLLADGGESVHYDLALDINRLSFGSTVAALMPRLLSVLISEQRSQHKISPIVWQHSSAQMADQGEKKHHPRCEDPEKPTLITSWKVVCQPQSVSLKSSDDRHFTIQHVSTFFPSKG